MLKKTAKKEPPVSVTVYRGPYGGDYYSGKKRVVVGNVPQMVHGEKYVLARWLEPYGNGESTRMIEVAYADIPRLIENLSHALAVHQELLAARAAASSKAG